MKNIFIWIIVLVALFSGHSAFTQSITGIITDEFEMPLPGVSVYVKGTTLGSVTDFDGLYTLRINEGDITSETLTLVISYVGYKTQEYIFPVDPAAEITKNIILIQY